ncbi:tetraspanin-9 isoform X1 [Hydra vulgaris]|uniref:tetraspanin-9 isoform X1 n=1 Tax=Hydra vulgaris TaxID=6087 RepID=UPI00019258CF|nr:tetraspanin-9 [Hydra vulgaris]
MISGGAKCIKYLLFIFNFLFFLTGCGLLGIGVWLNVEKGSWKAVSDYDFISIANTLIAAGVIIVIISFLGCCGAITENKCMLIVFFIFLLVIFLMEIISGIMAYHWRGTIKSELKTEIKKRIPSLYYKQEDVQKAMNTIQQTFNCCGIDSLEDWSVSAPDSNGKSMAQVDGTCCKKSGENGYNSSCKTLPYDSAKNTKLNQYYNTGCFSSIEDFLKKYTLYLGAVGIAFALFQIIGLIFSMVLICALKRDSRVL